MDSRIKHRGLSLLYHGLLAAALLALLFAAGWHCSREEVPPNAPPGKNPLEPSRAGLPAGGERLKVALGGIITPKEGLKYYLEFLEYLQEKLGRPIGYVDKEDYAEINELLRTGGVDFAFVCSGPYVDGHEKFGLELLVAPQAYGLTTYNAYIIVPRDSPAASFADLRGGTFAFTDPLSNTGNLVPLYMLARMGETRESFFGGIAYTHGHDKSIRAVERHLVDGASVDGLIWEYFLRTDPRFTAGTKVIEKSPPYGMPPVVVRPGLDAGVKSRLKDIFLGADRDLQGRAILGRMGIDRFTEITDAAYGSIREMKKWLAAGGARASG